MAELIDRADMFNRLSDKWDKAELYAVLQGMPEVEAEPVRHGKWEHVGRFEFCCSVCWNLVWTVSEEEMESTAERLKLYCPCCGARMDRDTV